MSVKYKIYGSIQLPSTRCIELPSFITPVPIVPGKQSITYKSWSYEIWYTPLRVYFGDLDLIFKVKSQLTNVKFLLKLRYFFNQLKDIHQTCMDISL